MRQIIDKRTRDGQSRPSRAARGVVLSRSSSSAALSDHLHLRASPALVIPLGCQLLQRNRLHDDDASSFPPPPTPPRPSRDPETLDPFTVVGTIFRVPLPVARRSAIAAPVAFAAPDSPGAKDASQETDARRWDTQATVKLLRERSSAIPRERERHIPRKREREGEKKLEDAVSRPWRAWRAARRRRA